MSEVTAPPPRILLVDDDEHLLRGVQRMLSSLGFAVLATTKPLEALDRYLANPSTFLAIVTDVSMPEMYGTELVTCIREAGGQLPALLITGKTEIDPAWPRLEKPFSTLELAVALAAIGVALPATTKLTG